MRQFSIEILDSKGAGKLVRLRGLFEPLVSVITPERVQSGLPWLDDWSDSPVRKVPSKIQFRKRSGSRTGVERRKRCAQLHAANSKESFAPTAPPSRPRSARGHTESREP